MEKPTPTYTDRKADDIESRIGQDFCVSDGEVKEINTTKRNIKPRHAHLIAIGGSIGTGIFVGTGATLA